MSDYKESGAVEGEAFCMPSKFKRLVDTQNRESKYPSWNAAADDQPNYPDVAMKAAKVNKQPMK